MTRQCLNLYENVKDTEMKSKIQAMINVLNERPDAGNLIQKSIWKKIPKYNYLNNLWRYELDKERRACYTIISDANVLTVIIIEIFLDHKSYEQRFGY